MKVGKIIKHYRQKNKLSQKELAEKINVTERTIGHYETGTRSPSLDILALIAKALHLQPKELLSPIKEEIEEIIFSETWFVFQKDNGVFALKKALNFEKYGIVQLIKARIGNELIYIPTNYVQRIFEAENVNELELNMERIDFGREPKRNQYVTFEAKKSREEKWFMQVDEFIEVVGFYSIRNHVEENDLQEKERQKKELASQLLTISLELSFANAHTNSITFKNLSRHVRELSSIIEKSYSDRIKETKLQEIDETVRFLTKEDLEAYEKSRQKSIEMIKEHGTNKEVIYPLAPTFDEIVELIKKIKMNSK